MKVGILTYHRSYNFGANLQALAVQSILRSKGVDPVFVNYQDAYKIEEYRKSVSPAQAEQQESFFSRYFNESQVLSDAQQVEEYCLDSLDCVIVGSDAVFRLTPQYDPIIFVKKLLGRKLSNEQKKPEIISPYWLGWEGKGEKSIVKASLAASSMGTNYHFFSKKAILELRRSIDSFDLISVRDRWTDKMIRFISNGKVHPEICPDPVFSLTNFFTIPKDEYPEIDLSKTILISGNYNKQWLKTLVQVAHGRGYKVAGLPNPDNFFSYEETDYNIPLPLSPLTWFLLFGQAAGYIGIRFHALVSCIVQNTPVINVDNLPISRFIKSGSKMYDLCERAGIQDHYYTLKRIEQIDPGILLNVLFEQQALDTSAIYVKNALLYFESFVDKILLASRP